MPRKEQEAVEEEPVEAAEAREEAEEVEPEAAETVESVETEDVVEEPASIFTQRYFQGIAVDSSGAKAGPFKLVVKNGTQFRVSQIKTIQSDMASFEIEVKGKLKNIRIKYDNIETFEKI